MRAQKSGKIINISSIGGKFAAPLGGWYHASKFALKAILMLFRLEVRPFGIDVVVIEPGGIASEWGGIAGNEAERISGAGAYRNLVTKFSGMQSGERQMPPPEVITDLIEALRARTPKVRYHGGMMAGPLLILRRTLSDRMLDRILMSAFR